MNTPLEIRKFYIEGSGQLCEKCWRELWLSLGSSDIQLEVTDMEFTYAEAIDLILDFYTFLCGYWKDEINKDPVVKRFVSHEGFTEPDVEYADLIVLTKKGGEFLHEYIKDISEKFIAFAKTKGLIVKHKEAQDWFYNTFSLSDEITSEKIAEYICGNLYHYGYRSSNCYSRRKGDYYQLVKI